MLSITIKFLFIICKARRFRKQIRRIGGTRWSIDSDTAGQKNPRGGRGRIGNRHNGRFNRALSLRRRNRFQALRR